MKRFKTKAAARFGHGRASNAIPLPLSGVNDVNPHGHPRSECGRKGRMIVNAQITSKPNQVHHTAIYAMQGTADGGDLALTQELRDPGNHVAIA